MNVCTIPTSVPCCDWLETEFSLSVIVTFQPNVIQKYWHPLFPEITLLDERNVSWLVLSDFLQLGISFSPLQS